MYQVVIIFVLSEHDMEWLLAEALLSAALSLHCKQSEIDVGGSVGSW